MPRYSLPRKPWQRVVFVLAIVALILARLTKTTPGDFGRDTGKPSATERTRSSTERGTAMPEPSARWETLTGCTLVEDKGNDGDSFILRHNGNDYHFRLYYADCPEKYRHQYNGDRIAEQGRYFGGLSETQVTASGLDAREFTLSLLRKGPVTAVTRWEHVYTPERRYAFVSAGGQDLAEALIRQGLARMHTKGANQPGAVSGSQEKERLRALEREAKSRRLGAWDN